MVINDGDEGNNDYDEDGDGDNNDEDEDVAMMAKKLSQDNYQWRKWG